MQDRSSRALPLFQGGVPQPRNDKQPDFTTKSEWAYEGLKNDIVSGVLGPGERLVVSQLAQRYAVSPSPIRDALNRLSQEGFVEITPHTGATVTSLDGRQLHDLVFLRMKLESIAAGLSVPRLTEESFALLESMHGQMKECAGNDDRLTYEAINWNFHDHMYSHCGNEMLYELAMSLWRKSCITRTVFFRLPAQLEHSIREHRRWLDAARAGDAEAVEKIVHGHLKHTLDRLEMIVSPGASPSGRR